MGKPGRPRTYPDAFRERAVRLVWEWRDSRGITTGGIADVARQLDINRETLRKWVVDEEMVEGNRPGVPRGAKDRIVELATLGWVHWWNHKRLHSALGHVPRAEHEAIYYRDRTGPRGRNALSEASTKPGAIQFARSRRIGQSVRRWRGP